MQIDNDRLDFIRRCGLAVQSPAVIRDCLRTIDKELDRFGAPSPTDWSGDYSQLALIVSSSNTIGLIAQVSSSCNTMYDKLMDDERTTIADTQHIVCDYYIERYLAKFDIKLVISFNFSCDLPSSDLETLEALGKVNRSSRTISEQSIICEV